MENRSGTPASCMRKQCLRKEHAKKTVFHIWILSLKTIFRNLFKKLFCWDNGCLHGIISRKIHKCNIGTTWSYIIKHNMPRSIREILIDPILQCHTRMLIDQRKHIISTRQLRDSKLNRRNHFSLHASNRMSNSLSLLPPSLYLFITNQKRTITSTWLLPNLK